MSSLARFPRIVSSKRGSLVGTDRVILHPGGKGMKFEWRRKERMKRNAGESI